MQSRAVDALRGDAGERKDAVVAAAVGFAPPVYAGFTDPATAPRQVLLLASVLAAMMLPARLRFREALLSV